MSTLLDKLAASDPNDLETVDACPLCRSGEATFMFWNCDRLYHLPGRFGIVRCDRCDLFRLSPRPKEESIGSYYPEDLFYSYQEATVSINQIAAGTGSSARLKEYIRQIVLSERGYPVESLTPLQRTLKRPVGKVFFTRGTYGWGERFPSYRPGGRALDIGSGNGTFLSFLKHHGWDVRGVDLSQRAADVAKSSFGIDVFVGDLADAGFAEASFDFVNMSHVLEHVYDPAETMELVHKLLKRNGTVYIEVPNGGSYSCKQSAEFWFGWESPRHIYTFSPKNLSELLESKGFSISKLETQMADLFPWTNTYMLEDSVGEIGKRPLVRPQDMPKVVLQRLASRLHKVLDPMSGDFICCWATKK